MKIFITALILSLAGPSLAKDFLPTAFHSEFTQEYTSKVSGKTVTTKGEITYLYPGHLKLHVKVPDEVLYVANPKQSWYYTPPFAEGEPGELKTSDDPDNVLNRFFDVLKKGLTSNDSYLVAKGKTGGHVLTFREEAAKSLGVKEAVIFFKGSSTDFGAMERLKIKDNEDQVKDFTLTKLDLKTKVRGDQFIFTAPENTRISK